MDIYLWIKTITITGVGADATAKTAVEKKTRKKYLKSCTIYELHKWNNPHIDNPKDPHVVMLMYNLIEYKENHSKTSESLLHDLRDEPCDPDKDTNTASKSFKLKVKIP